MTLNELVQKAHENAKAKGWHDEQRSFGELIALCHSELSEALEEFRKGYKPVDSYYSCSACAASPCLSFGDINHCSFDCCKPKPEGIPAELADVVIRIADLCGLYGIDLEAAVLGKMQFNSTRSIRHGGKVI